MILKDLVTSYARKQELVDFLSILIFTLGTVLITLSISLLLLKSPFYCLIGFIPLAFYRPRNFIQRAREFDKKIGANCELISCLQIAKMPDDNREGYSKELASAFIEATIEKYRHINPDDFVTKDFLSRAVSFLFVSIIFFLLYPALFPGRFWFALYHKIEYNITPQSGRFHRGDTLDINLNVYSPYQPDKVRFVYQIENITNAINVPVIDGRATKNIEISGILNYHFEFFGMKTKPCTLAVIEPIYLDDLSFRLIYPAYTGLREEIKTERQLIVPTGTIVEITGRASQPLKQAKLFFNDTVDLVCDGNRFSGKFKINTSGSANIYLAGESFHNETMTIYAIPDLPPLVEIFYPGYNINLPPDMKISVGIKCSDDYGLNRIVFKYQFKDTKDMSIKFKRGSTEDTIFYDWNLQDLRMLPGDRVSYFVEVEDYLGQKSKSKSYSIYFPTMEQIYEEIKGKEDLVQADLKEVEKTHQEGLNEINRLEEKLKRERELSWLDSEKLKEVVNKEENILQKIEEWQDELKNTMEKLKNSIILDQKSIERLQEITKILQEIAPEELKRALENIKQAMEKKPEEIKQAMEKLKDAQEELAKALERTLELLKRYQQEEKLKELSERAKELANQASDLHNQQQIKGMENLKESMDSLYQAIDSLAQEIEKLAQSEGMEQNISDDLKSTAQQTRSMAQNHELSADGLKKSLDKLAEDLQKLYEELTRGRSANLRRNLLETLNQLIELSKLEEELMKQEKIDPDIQSEIVNATKDVAESLYAQQVKSIYVGPEISRRLSRAIKEMNLAAINHSNVGKMNAREAMKQLNLASLAILQGLQKATEGGGSSTGMEQFLKNLSEITQNQMGIGQSLFNLFPLSVSGLTPEQMAQIQRLAGKQRALRQALESLKGSPEASRYEEMLNNLAEEMKETEEALYQYKLDRKLIERQQLIISRLLDAEKSIRQEDWTKERKSKPGEDIKRASPMPLPEELGRDELLEIIQRALKQPYPEEYELYIREYFRALLDKK
ncbi:MAG: hypothetical protein ACUVUH_05445 [bacterium]